ncbi:MAG: SPASM domain-containing protein [Planctomycetota bacterium]
MNIVGAICADFERAPCGLPAQLNTPVAGRPLIAHTLRRVAQVEGLAARCVFVRARDRDAAAAAVQAAGLADKFELLPIDSGARPRATLLTAARKWNLESWRGGLLGATWFDEFVDPPAVAAVLNHYRCDGVLCIEGHQPALDPAIATAMLRHASASRERSKLTFTQAPPGLAGILLRRECLEDLLEYRIPLGLTLSYRPELAQTDPIVHEACYHVDPAVAQTAARLLGDTRRSRALLDAAFRELGEDASAGTLCGWLRQPGHDRGGALPVELEVELTTADPLPNTKLRPRGARVPKREILDFQALARVIDQLSEYDDRLVYLGGHGDPLQHPKFAEACRTVRSAGIFGLAVGTPLVDLTEGTLAALFENEVDVLEVFLDAHTPETYRQVHGADEFERVQANIARLEAVRRAQHRPRPIIACSITRCAATHADVEAFYDHWLRQSGAAVIRGYRQHAGCLPPDTLLPTCSAERRPCRRLASRLLLLADGRAVACDEDPAGGTCLGNWCTESLRTIWGGRSRANLLQAHADADLKALPTCRTCQEWNRP